MPSGRMGSTVSGEEGRDVNHGLVVTDQETDCHQINVSH